MVLRSGTLLRAIKLASWDISTRLYCDALRTTVYADLLNIKVYCTEPYLLRYFTRLTVKHCTSTRHQHPDPHIGNGIVHASFDSEYSVPGTISMVCDNYNYHIHRTFFGS